MTDYNFTYVIKEWFCVVLNVVLTETWSCSETALVVSVHSVCLRSHLKALYKMKCSIEFGSADSENFEFVPYSESSKGSGHRACGAGVLFIVEEIEIVGGGYGNYEFVLPFIRLFRFELSRGDEFPFVCPFDRFEFVTRLGLSSCLGFVCSLEHSNISSCLEFRLNDLKKLL
ncbi:hypothetical protein BpHYR1_049573 [Brachionus plicatilis]|uniref:Uncharacterized protein n=1 Tax=Brachionus plicatilis TaxID=10195 RepID=A0A3M7P3Y8_BRAPC|nr:hypothetical protein BpHYR1_049573 [Brachionus plicatilis]